MKPSAIRRLGLTYESLREFNDGIVWVALTGFGLDGGDDPAFDYVIQAATGVAAMIRMLSTRWPCLVRMENP